VLIDRRTAGPRNLRHRFEKFAPRRGIGRAPRRIEATPVSERQVAVETEEFRRAHRVVGAGDLLRFVDDVRKREAVLRGERLHVVERILRIRRRVVAHDRDAADAECGEFIGVAHELAGDGAHVRAVVADEHDEQAVRSARAVLRVTAAVDARQVEACGGPSECYRR
jgi:hypothetical protein